jgi:AcrR family transcriptional regulator
VRKYGHVPKRPPLTAQRIIEAAAAVADDGGLAAVSMRNVAKELKVEAMSLYHHVADKESLLDGLADWIVEQIELPDVTDPWRAAMSARAHSAHDVLSTHPWAISLIESRPAPGLPLLRHHDRIVGCLLESGFSAALATHAFSAIDAYVYGFTLSEAHLPFTPGDGAEEAFASDVAPSADEFPYLARSLGELMETGTYSYGAEFGYGLELILDGFATRLAAGS